MVNRVIDGLQGREAYINDLIIYADSWEEHLKRSAAFERLSEAKLTLNLSKSKFGHAEVTFWGMLLEMAK